MSTILVVDDKDMLRDSVGITLQRAGFTVLAASGGQAALDIISRRKPDAVVTDLKMPGMTGLELLEHVREFDEDLPVVMMTAFGAVDSAVKAMKLGAFTYITKPFEGDELLVAVKRAIEHTKLKRDNAVLRITVADSGASRITVQEGAGSPQRVGINRIIGQSDAMEYVKSQLRSIAGSQGSVLIQGESGVGKEVVARAIHELSPRIDDVYLTMNCAALAESLLESELFGHEKGAFTGAERLRKGRFELADGGTLLLDEISEVSPQIQAKLLRVLQEQAFERVGSSATIRVDVRVIATTNRDLPAEVEKGSFRQDLFFRLNVLPIHIPPLRERQADVPALAEHFVGAVCNREGRAKKTISPNTIQLLQTYSWPGNVRELQNICERAVVLCPGDVIEADLIHPWLLGGAAPARTTLSVQTRAIAPAPSAIIEAKTTPTDAPSQPIIFDQPRKLEDIERQVIVETLAQFDGHRQRTAKALGIGVRTLGLKLKRWKEEQLVSETL